MGTKRRWQRWPMIALMAALFVLVTTTTGGVSAQTAPSCTATYSIVAQWTGSFLGQVVVRNSGSSPTTGWKVRWTFPNGQVINQVTSSTFTQTGADVTLTNVIWNGAIAPGGTQGGGVYIMANWSGVNNPPASVICTAT